MIRPNFLFFLFHFPVDNMSGSGGGGGGGPSSSSGSGGKKPLTEYTHEELITRCKGLLAIAQKAKVAKDGV